jgi:acetate kinase
MSSAAAILAVNIGSSSIKFAVHPVDVTCADLQQAVGDCMFQGSIQGLEPGGKASASWSRNGQMHREPIRAAGNDAGFIPALAFLKDLLGRELADVKLLAVAHRVVHGGDAFRASVIATPEILEKLEALDPLAPLHQPHNLHGIRTFAAIFPGLPQVACFDTAFHASISRTEKTFPLTKALSAAGIHRYGFHGLSYQYISTTLARHSPRAHGRLLMAHLGNGSSLCACMQGKSFATTMGFSAAGGLMMGTRCGDLDPGVMLYLVQQGADARALEKLVYQDSGLKGISGISADMRTLRQDGSDDARFAIELYTHRIIREAGGLITAMGGVDVIAFAGGIGENDHLLRRDVCKRLAFLGVDIDDNANQHCPGSAQAAITALHTPTSKIEVWVVPTDEGIVAAKEALRLI